MEKIFFHFGFTLLVCLIFALAIFQHRKIGCTPHGTYIMCIDVRGKFSFGANGYEDIRYIIFNNSDLTSLTAEDFSVFPEVRKIEILNSNLSFPKQGFLFSSLKDLTELFIENCDVDNGVGVSFARNEYLERLHLAGNKITSIPHELKDLPHIEEVDLSNNQISDLKHYTLEGLDRLRSLDLRNNRINEIEQGVLALPFHRCFVCRPKGDHAGCSYTEMDACSRGRHLDRLWWNSLRVSVNLTGNPVCDMAATSPVTPSERNAGRSFDDEDCKVLEHVCYLHERRKLFLMESCGIENMGRMDHPNLLFIGIAVVIIFFITEHPS